MSGHQHHGITLRGPGTAPLARTYDLASLFRLEVGYRGLGPPSNPGAATGSGESSAASSITLDHKPPVAKRKREGEEEEKDEDEEMAEEEGGYYDGVCISVRCSDEEWIGEVGESSDKGEGEDVIEPLEPITPNIPIGQPPAQKKFRPASRRSYRFPFDKWMGPGAKPPNTLEELDDEGSRTKVQIGTSQAAQQADQGK